MNNYLPLIIPTIAGLTTILGIIPTYFKFNQNKIINSSISFSLGVMLTISIISLIPESLHYLNRNLIESIIYILIFINIGILTNRLIDRKVSINNNLYKLGIVSMIAIIMHNIPEGIITSITTEKNLSLGISTSIGIALHNIPEGISISIPIYFATKSRKKAYIYTTLSGLSELLGALISIILLKNFINNFILAFILGITAGIMIDISINELLKESLSYNNKKITIPSILLGIVIMLICKYIFNI